MSAALYTLAAAALLAAGGMFASHQHLATVHEHPHLAAPVTRLRPRDPDRLLVFVGGLQRSGTTALASAPRYGTITAKVGLRRRGGAWSGVVVDGGAAHSAFGGGRWQPPIMWCSYHEQPGETKWKPPSAAAATVDAMAREVTRRDRNF